LAECGIIKALSKRTFSRGEVAGMRRIAVAVMLCAVVLCATAALAEEFAPVLEQTDKAKINWTDGFVEATGQAVAPSDKSGTGQGKLLARRGAIVDLQRNLLEFVQGVKVNAETTMQDFMANDYVKTEVHGTIKNVEVVDSSWDGEIYTVVGRIRLGDLRKAVTPALPTQPTPKKEPAPVKGKSTGLVLDVRHLPLIPAMTFRVVDEKGKVLYSLDFVDRERFLASGLCEYQTNMNYATGVPRVTDKPTVIKAKSLVGPNNVDIVISNSDAAKIPGGYDYRIPCRVVVVKR